MLISSTEDNFATISIKERKFRCSKGHEWTVKTGQIDNNIIVTDSDGNKLIYCTRCAAELIKERLGKVTEIQ